MKPFAFGRAAFVTVACVSFLHWVTSCRTNTPAQSPVGANAAAGPAAPGESGTPGACDSAADPAECYLERAWLIEELLGDLYELEDARDKRSIPAALDALDTGEPDVQIEALRVLGPFADEPGVGAKVLPWVLADDYRREENAANVLRSTKNASLVRIGEQFASGHSGDNAAPPLSGWWRDPSPHGLEAYPGATRFPPGDSVRSIGLLTADSVDTVLAHYAGKTNQKPLDASAYQTKVRELKERDMKRVVDSYQSPEFVARQKQIQELAQKFAETHDMKLLEQIKALSEQFQKQPPPQAVDPGGALTVPMPSGGPDTPFPHMKWLSLEERDGVPLRAVYAYAEPAVGKTVVILAWGPVSHMGPPDPRRVQLH